MRALRPLLSLAALMVVGQAGAQSPAPTIVPVGAIPRGVAVDPNSTTAVIANFGEGTLSVVNMATGKVTSTVPSIPSPVGVAYNTLGLVVVANQFNNTVTIVEVSTGKVRAVINVGSGPVGVAVNPNSNLAVVANALGNSVSLVDLSTLQAVGGEITGIPGPTGLQSVAVDPTRNIAVVASSSTNSIFLIDLAKRQLLGDPIQVEQTPVGVAIDSKSGTAAVVNQNSGSVSLVDLTTKTVRSTVSGVPSPQAVAISPASASALVTTGANGALQVVNLNTGVVENTFSDLPSASGVAFNVRTGQTIVTLSTTSSAAVIASLGIITFVNGATFLSGPVAPASIISAFGTGLSSLTQGAVGLPLPNTLNKISVRAGSLNMPLFYVSPSQINCQVPTLSPGSYLVQVFNNGIQIGSGSLSIIAAAPSIFSNGPNGTGQAVALNQDYLVNGTASGGPASSGAFPAPPGTVIQIFGTGGGLTDPNPATGSASVFAAPTRNIATAQIGGLNATVLYSGAAPGFVGLWQVNVRIPSNVTTGNAVPVVITQNGVASNRVTIVVQ